MAFLARMNPLRAVRDLRRFLAQRQPYELWFMMLAMALTLFVLYAFMKDSNIAPVYRPQIVYVQQWRLDRTDGEIRAQQLIDQAKKDRENAELAKRQAETQAEFKRLDDRLKSMGL